MRILYILCGGKGRRLGAITRKVPKSLIKVNGKAFLSHLIRLYSGHFDRIILLAGYKGEEFLKFKDDNVDVLVEDEPLGTGGALIYMKKDLPNRFFVCNGDTFLYPLDLRGFMSFCENRNRSALLLSNEERKARGAVRTADGKVAEFMEKSTEGKGKVYTGMCFIRRKDLPDYAKRMEISLEREIFPKLAYEGALLAYETECAIYDIGTPKGIKKFKELNQTI
ncbi:MAG: NTP transferase domain-containing protein [Candidatus Micrarchaeia archaeon]